MPKNKMDFPNKRLAIYTVMIFSAILVFWTLSWIVKIYLFDNYEWFSTSFGSFVYWTTCKIIIWILPCFLMLKSSNRKFSSVFKLHNRNWLIWSLIIGLMLSVINISSNIFSNQDILPRSLFSFASLNVIVIAPLFEEFLFRGIILDNLKKNISFWSANIISSVFFLLIHIPGWFFMGTLQANFLSFVGVSVFLLGLVFGLAYKKGESVLSSVIVHMLNNIT